LQLRGEVTKVRSNLKHFAQIIRQLATQEVSIKDFGPAQKVVFSVMADDVDSKYDEIIDLMGNLSALVDLRLNESSFQMNKVMRLSAILTSLALIPAVSAGLLGINLTDSPWALTLPQVSFCIASSWFFAHKFLPPKICYVSVCGRITIYTLCLLSVPVFISFIYMRLFLCSSLICRNLLRSYRLGVRGLTPQREF
jgi:hypothetical protein